MDVLQKAYLIAKTQLGIKELPGKYHQQRILDYHATTTLKASDDETPWCSAFVNWCVIQASGVGTNSAAARSWLNWGLDVCDDGPEVGDLVILSRASTNPKSAHVGFLSAPYNSDPELVLVLGGNQGDEVCEKWFSKKLLLGIRKATPDRKPIT